MSRKLTAFAVATGLAALVTGGIALGGSAAARPSTHTMHFNSSPTNTVNLGSKDFVTNGTLRHRHLGKVGQRAGATMFTCESTSKGATTFHCLGSMGLKGGELFATVTVSFKQNRLNGTITGGSGVFAGATGTLRGVSRHSHSILTATFTD